RRPTASRRRWVRTRCPAPRRWSPPELAELRHALGRVGAEQLSRDGAESFGRRVYRVPRVSQVQARRERDRFASVWRVEHELAQVGAGDTPAAVMQLHMVEAAEQDAAIDVRAAL